MNFSKNSERNGLVKKKKIVESLKNKLTVPYLLFIAIIANDFEHFLVMFQSMIHLLYTEMVQLIRTLMSKFVKSRLLVDEIDGKKSPKSITDLPVTNVTDIKNCKPIKLVQK